MQILSNGMNNSIEIVKQVFITYFSCLNPNLKVMGLGMGLGWDWDGTGIHILTFNGNGMGLGLKILRILCSSMLSIVSKGKSVTF